MLGPTGFLGHIKKRKERMLNEEDQLPSTQSRAPHVKPKLTTRWGQFVDRATYLDILVFGMLLLLLVSTYFTFAPDGHGLGSSGTSVDVSFGNALYFSVVTLTSLGYGDYSPLGLGKVVSGVTVLSGLGLFALLFGKIASERSQSLLHLVHRSDVQRRLAGFNGEVSDCLFSLERLLAKKEGSELSVELKKLSQLYAAISNYVVFNANQSNSVEFGNDSALLSLLKGLSVLQERISEIHCFAQNRQDKVLAARSMSLVARLPWLVSFCIDHFDAARDQSILVSLIKGMAQKSSHDDGRTSGFRNVHLKMVDCHDRLIKWRRSQICIDLLDDILELCPSGPFPSWPKDFNKKLAAEMKVSVKMAGRYINFLKVSGSLPK